MTEMDQFKAIMTAKYDEGLASVREFINRSGDDEICQFAMTIIEDMGSRDIERAVFANLAIVGLFGAWLSSMEDRE